MTKEADDISEMMDFQIEDDLRDIISSEATNLLETVVKESDILATRSFVTYDLMRAFHTLGSVSALAGAKHLSELSYATESLVSPFVNNKSTIKPEKAPGDVLEVTLKVRDVLVDAYNRFLQENTQDDLSALIAEVRETGSSANINMPSVALNETDEKKPTTIILSDISESQEQAPLTDLEFGIPVVRLSDALSDPIVADLDEDIEPELLGIFYDEMQGHVDDIAKAIDIYEKDITNKDALKAITRSLHTIKGGVRMAGALKAGMFFHETENTFEKAAKTGISDEVFNNARTQIAKGVLITQQNFFDFIGPQAVVNISKLVISEDSPTTVTEYSPEIVVSEQGRFKSKFVKDAYQPNLNNDASSVRVSQSSMDTMLTISGETTILRARMDSMVNSILENSPQMTVTLNRLRSLIRDIETQGELMINSGGHAASHLQLVSDSKQSEVVNANGEARKFDPLQMDRFTKLQEVMRMASESINDLDEMYSGLDTSVESMKSIIELFDVQGSDMHRLLSSSLMIGVDSMVGRFRKTVTQAAKETNKKVKLELVGDGRMDRQALEKVSGAIDHILRNGVAHGIESQEKRIAAGKPVEGQIKIVTSMDGDEVMIEIFDDGSGINKEKVRNKAESKGLVSPGQEMTEDDVVNLIFASGFSTADEVSAIAGRGVGLDAVKKDIESMGGFVRVSSDEGKGSKFTLRVRSTIATIAVLPMKVNDNWYAIPATSVLKVVMERPSEDGRSVMVENKQYLLADIYGDLVEIKSAEPISCILIRNSNIAVHVDNLSHGRELIMKKLGKQSASLLGVMGASVMEDGATALIVNPARIASMAKFKAEQSANTNAPKRARKVLVVDDSLTVRKATERFLSREGFQVEMAVDGLDGFEKMESFMPDIILSDIEMPKMDGFEFVKTVRGNARYQKIPIIMISSRSIDTHINHALSIGANAYFGKPYIESDVLKKIRELTRSSLMEAA